MGKAARRKRPARAPGADDVHACIADEVARNRSANSPSGLADHAQSPAIVALLHAAVEQINAALPAQFEHEGGTYWLRCSIGLARVEVFDGPAKGSPIVVALCGSSAGQGHTPLH